MNEPGSGNFVDLHGWDAPDIRPDNSAFFYNRYPAGYQITLPDIWLPVMFS
jgi:hypothetical protein